MYYVYILCDEPNGKLYTGFTDNVSRRLWEHMNGVRSKYVHKLGLFRLVHLEVFGDYRQAIEREKQVKKLRRNQRIDLIERNNPKWTEYPFKETSPGR